MPITTMVPSVPNYIGTPPSSADPANFDARADYHVLYESQLGAALNPYAAALNAIAPVFNADVAAASASADIAIGAANYRGDYLAGTTYLLGQSVSYLGERYIAKKTNFGITPVDGNDWLLIPQARTQDFLLINAGVI